VNSSWVFVHTAIAVVVLILLIWPLGYNIGLLIAKLRGKAERDSFIFLVVPVLASVAYKTESPLGPFMWIPVVLDPATYLFSFFLVSLPFSLASGKKDGT
jgi:hypothetical protein